MGQGLLENCEGNCTTTLPLPHCYAKHASSHPKWETVSLHKRMIKSCSLPLQK